MVAWPSEISASFMIALVVGVLLHDIDVTVQSYAASQGCKNRPIRLAPYCSHIYTQFLFISFPFFPCSSKIGHVMTPLGSWPHSHKITAHSCESYLIGDHHYICRALLARGGAAYATTSIHACLDRLQRNIGKRFLCARVVRGVAAPVL